MNIVKDEIALTLNSPVTEEQWDDIMDVDFDHTDRITFHTKHGREVEFVKRKKGHWIKHERGFWTRVNEKNERDGWIHDYECSECGSRGWKTVIALNFCPVCGADMRGEQDESD